MRDFGLAFSFVSTPLATPPVGRFAPPAERATALRTSLQGARSHPFGGFSRALLAALSAFFRRTTTAAGAAHRIAHFSMPRILTKQKNRSRNF